MKRRIALAAVAAVIAACSEGMTGPGPEAPTFDAVANGGPGAVFTMTNAPGGNEVIQFARAGDGALTEVARYATGGTGTGAGLGNQGGVILTNGGRLLLVVNAGSNDVSLFRRRANGTWVFVDRESSGGTMPVSVTSHGRHAYVLNAGGDGGISGFVVQETNLIPLSGSSQPLSQAGGAGPAQIEFSPNGRHLVVTEKATNRIVTYAVGGDGRAGAPRATPSAGMTPFGFAFRSNGLLVVSEAVGGAPGAGLVSTYSIEGDGSVRAVDPAVPDHQSAPCWIVITRNGRYTYTTNTASNSISGFLIRGNGTLELLDSDGVTAMSDAGPIDAALTRGTNEFLYVLNAGGGSITVYRVENGGALTPISGGIGGMAGANGLAAM
jgi:6-phosphogluconolactonase (cycloisomerase 2 family)